MSKKTKTCWQVDHWDGKGLGQILCFLLEKENFSWTKEYLLGLNRLQI